MSLFQDWQSPRYDYCHDIISPFPNNKFWDSSKLKEFTDDNFKFDENGTKFSKRVEETLGKGEIAVTSNFSFSQWF